MQCCEDGDDAPTKPDSTSPARATAWHSSTVLCALGVSARSLHSPTDAKSHHSQPHFMSKSPLGAFASPCHPARATSAAPRRRRQRRRLSRARILGSSPPAGHCKTLETSKLQSSPNATNALSLSTQGLVRVSAQRLTNSKLTSIEATCGAV